jgi:hypothetical protein
MRSAFRPLPLLAFAEALADHLIYRRFHKARADAFAVPVALAVIWNEATIVLNVGVKLLHESIQIWGQPRTSATIYGSVLKVEMATITPPVQKHID